ncbi:hypothetical protein V8E53_009742 [Lactarius tabidus]
MPRLDASTVVAILELMWVIEGCFTRTVVACRGHDDSGSVETNIADLIAPSVLTTEIGASARTAASWGLLSSIRCVMRLVYCRTSCCLCERNARPCGSL